jgi:filamentous hemagglutinin family protein
MAAYALPQGGLVSGGQASIAENGALLTVTQHTGRAIIDWSQFNLSSGEGVRFDQPSTGSVALNRVHDIQASQIDGSLTANGSVWLINPNGVVFGKNAQIDVGGLLVSTSDIRNDRFMSGDYRFDIPGNLKAAIVNNGNITIRPAGQAAIVAPQVINRGTITAELGQVHLASGDEFTLDVYGDGLINLAAGDAVLDQLVDNSGVIAVEGGTVKLSAAAAQTTINSLINIDGLIDVTTVGGKTGQMLAYAVGSNAVQGNVAANKGVKSGTSTVLVKGTIDATGMRVGEKGGTVEVLGDHVGIMSGAVIDASGQGDGGTVRVGGDFHGQGATPAALATVVQCGAAIRADAIAVGDGGNVAVWADDYINFAGSISAKGGSLSGNGGFVETSGKQVLDMSGHVNASAPNGNAGTWLLDPADVIISNVNSNIAGDPSFLPSGAASTIDAASIVADLNAGTNVTVTTGGDALAGSGDITVANAISANNVNTGKLTLSAYRNITVNGAINLGNDLTLHANNAGNSSGYINIAAAINTHGGNITLGGGNGAITAGTLDADGTINAAATGFAVGNGGQDSGILINNVTVGPGDGNIIVNGQGYNTTADNNYGVYVTGAGGALTTSGTGTINITGTGTGSTHLEVLTE